MPGAWALCPLCPHAFQSNVAQLALHLKTSHRMHNSANLLARIIVYTPCGKEDAFQVLKDVQELERSLDQKNQEMIKRNKNLEAKEKKMHIDIDELKAELSEATKEQTSLQKIFKKYKEDSAEKFFEKNQKITELNLKIKELYEDVELLKETQRKYREASDELISEKDKTVTDLKNKVENLGKDVEESKALCTNVSKEKNLLQENFENFKECSSITIKEKDHEIANLGYKVRDLSKEVEASNVRFFHLYQDFSRQKDLSNKMITEKDSEIANLNSKASDLYMEEEKSKELIYTKCKENDRLQQELKKSKQLSDEIIEKNRAKNEKTLAEMELKLKRHRKVFCLLKNAITGVADMYNDTFDKLLEANEITIQSRKIAENNLVCRLQDLEKEVAKLYPEENIFIPKLSVRKDIFKQETTVAQNLVEDADTRFNNGELDKAGERIGKERSLNLKRNHAE